MDNSDLVRNWGYINPGEDRHYYSNRGGHCFGELIGILVLDSWLPIPPGHVDHAGTFDFPVLYMDAEGTNQKRVHGGDVSVLDGIIEAAQKLERHGCRAICADCGYFGNFQKEVAASVSIPVYMSSVIQVPWIRAALRPDQKIGVICGDAPHLTYNLFESCGVSREDYERCVIYGLQDEAEFYKFDKNVGNFDSAKVREEVVKVAKKMQAEHPDIGAILLECTDLPPYAASVQAATNLPVYDVIGMVKYAHHAIAQRPYGGFV